MQTGASAASRPAVSAASCRTTRRGSSFSRRLTSPLSAWLT